MFNVAIDGPAGAGKSTVAKKAAKELGFIYVDTGAMYRAIGLFFLMHGIDISDEAECASRLDDIDVRIAYEDGIQKVYLNGKDVSSEIRTEEVSDAASKTSAYPKVREKLLYLQRNLADKNNVIMDGRDIGTTILPNADLKVYLTASVSERARRRYLEYRGKGIPCELAEIEKEIEERDFRDKNREVSPLRMAEDAVLLDTSDMDREESVQALLKLVSEKQNGN